MQTQYDENVSDSWKLPSGDYIVKMKQDDGLNLILIRKLQCQLILVVSF